MAEDGICRTYFHLSVSGLVARRPSTVFMLYKVVLSTAVSLRVNFLMHKAIAMRRHSCKTLV